MDSFLTRYKNIMVLMGVVLIQIVGLAAQIRRPNANGTANGTDGSTVRLIRYWAVGLVAPPEKVLHGTGHGIRGLWSDYLDLRGVRRQNQDLRDQIGRLQLEQAALLEDARQGQRLQQLLSFQEHYVATTVPAQVIGTAGTDQSRVLFIDKGSHDGLKPDMAVITPDGIVGKLKDVFPHTAQVLEISDQSSGAGVLLESTRLRGVLRGNELGQPQVINLLPDERIKPGEHVITSGGDQIYPRGLPVGVVERTVADTQNPPYVDVIIKPAANLGHLEEVLIITKTSDQMPPKQRQDLAQSAAVAAAAGTQRAADILAQRLPGLDPAAPAGDGNPQKTDPSGADMPAAAPRPPAPLHTDRFTPDSTPPAGSLTPGQPFTVTNSTPLPAGDGTADGKAVRPAAKKPAAPVENAPPSSPAAPPLSNSAAPAPSNGAAPATGGPPQ
jgi:rod shape-determining protein MreC